MKIRFNILLIALYFIAIGCTNVEQTEGVRLKKNINREWQFTFSSKTDNFSTDESEGAKWERVGLPHSFSLPYFRSESFYQGYGWYQKKLNIKKELLGKHLYVESWISKW